MNSSFASGCQVVQHVAFLLAQGHHCRQDALDKHTPSFTLGAKTAFAPQNTRPQSSFRRIIGGFHPFLVDKSPQCSPDFEDILAGTPGFAVAQQGANFQQIFPLSADWLDGRLQIAPRQGAIAEMMPEAKKLFKTHQ